MNLRPKRCNIFTKILLVLVLAFAGTTAVFGQNPVANFTANVTSGCAPLTVSFTDQSTGNPTSWNWEFSNGTLSSAQNPVVTFAIPGTYSVRLVVQNANGIGQFERIDYITVFPSPTANFSSNLTLACIPAQINFTDLSTIPSGTITSWEWDFGDGGTSALQNPSHTFTNVGFYTITFTVTGSTGCRQSITRGSYIRTVGAVATDFAFTQPATCQAPFLINFQNQSSGPGNITYNWDFGNGQTSTVTNPSNIYTTAGTYTVTLNAQSDLGCTGSIQKQINIVGTTTDFTVPANICLNQPITFQNNSSATPVLSTWDFGDGTTSSQVNPVKTFLTAGTYNVRLINQYSNCTDSITKIITVTDLPVVDFTVNDSSGCQVPFTAQFTDLTPGAVSWLWDFGDGTTSTLQNPSHTYTTIGDYTVTLTATTASGCSNTVTKTAFIKIQPTTVRLNLPAGGCIPFTYIPQATIVTLDTIATYLWDFGNGQTSTAANPAPVNYPLAGSYNISLTVTTVSGCAVTVNVPNGVRTGIPPIVNFSISQTDFCASDSISFTDLSTTTPGAEVEWTWYFGDGATATTQNVRHVYTDTGLLTVTLVVSNNRCIDSASQTVQVRPPVARFNYTFDCVSRQVTFRDTSLVDINLPVSYLWDFGNGQTSVLQNPLPVFYPTPGQYDVSLTVTNGGCSYTSIRSIIIANEPATFTINKNPVCRNEIFTLNAGASNPANVISYIWTVGGVTLAGNGQTVSHSIATNGTYDVTLTIIDINGCITTQTATNFITVNGPAANFIPVTPGACLNKTVSFTDLSTPAGSITNWNFDFGDGTTQNFSAAPFTHTYNRLGGFIVSMTVRDNAGCTDTYTLPTTLLVTDPKAGFRADTFYCPAAPLQFSDTSIGAGLTYEWTFGDGGTSTLQNPVHSYPMGNASYSVKLKVTDISGCADSVTKSNYIDIKSPVAAFSIRDTTTICPPLRTSFTFQGSDYQSFYWDFGDGGMSTLQNPTYFYGNYGTFTPTLYTIGPGGCIDSASSSVTLHNPADIQINYGPVTTACNSLNVDFNLVIPAGYKFIFFFGDGTADSTRRTSFSHFYSRPGFNTPSLLVYDSLYGCQIFINGPTRIDVLGAIPLFGLDRDELCDNGLVNFTDFTTRNEPIISTVWNFGDGATSGLQSPIHNYTQPGTYIVTLNITTQSNCSSSFQDTVLVYRTPVPSILSRDTICPNITEPFNGIIAVADTLTNWQWNFGNGQNSTQQNNNITYTTSGNYTVQLTTTNKIGCSNTITKNIFVTPLPTATPVQDPITIISGAGTDLLMNYTGNIVSYNWGPSTRLSCTTCPVPFANPQFTTTYQVQVTDAYGCRANGDVTVVVVCNGQNFFIPNTFSPNGDGVNEIFYPRGTGLFRIKSMIVFNRWGQVMFDKKEFTVNDPSQGWNGTFKGQKASADVYVYRIEILCDNNTIIPVKGNITLLR